jgi:hypothetical protein
VKGDEAMIAFAKKAKASVGNWVTKHLKLWLNVLREFFMVPVFSLDEPWLLLCVHRPLIDSNLDRR